ncbi:MAG: RagB/SusD family nutrient uptake outer membrane protein, partial [Cytophagaceae bacterium]
ALMRKNGNVPTPEALDLVNAVRKRAFTTADYVPYTATTLTPAELLAERGREFVFEGKRRTDMIRFGAFTTNTWWDHQPSDPTKTIFPIPQRQLAANPNLVQNPGYPAK